MRDIPRKRLAVGFVILGFFLICVWRPPNLFLLNFSDSVPAGLYLRVSCRTVNVGDMVVYMPTDDVVDWMRKRGWFKDGEKPLPFLKYVGGLSGDTFAAIGHRFYINDEYIGDILDTDSGGIALPQISGAHQVPAQEFLPLSSDAKGFDGRYTGCVPINRIIAKAIPLLVVYR